MLWRSALVAALWLFAGRASAAPPAMWPVDRTPEQRVYIDGSGNVRLRGPYGAALPFSNGLARAAADGALFGFLDARGVWRVAPRFEEARDFHEDLAAVGLRPVDEPDVGPLPWGYIDRTGKLVVPAVFGGALDFSEGLAPIAGLADGGKWGYIDHTGAIAIAPQFDAADVFVDGLAAATAAGPVATRRAGFIDRTGHWVIAAVYRATHGFSEGLAAVTTEARTCGYIDKNGDFAIAAQFLACGAFHEGLAAVQTTSGSAYVNPRGEIVIPGPFAVAGDFSGGLAFVEAAGVYGFYIDRTGKPILPTVFARTRRERLVLVSGQPFAGHVAAVVVRRAEQTRGGDPAWIDRHGRIIWRSRIPACTRDR